MKNASDIEIPGNAIVRIIGTDCWYVPSHTPGHDDHKVCWNAEQVRWECSCSNGKEMAKRGQSARCYAVNAVMVSVLANKQEYLLASEPVDVTYKSHTVADEPDPFVHPERDAKPVPYSQRGALYGNRDFNLFK